MTTSTSDPVAKATPWHRITATVRTRKGLFIAAGALLVAALLVVTMLIVDNSRHNHAVSTFATGLTTYDRLAKSDAGLASAFAAGDKAIDEFQAKLQKIYDTSGSGYLAEPTRELVKSELSTVTMYAQFKAGEPLTDKRRKAESSGLQSALRLPSNSTANTDTWPTDALDRGATYIDNRTAALKADQEATRLATKAKNAQVPTTEEHLAAALAGTPLHVKTTVSKARPNGNLVIAVVSPAVAPVSETANGVLQTYASAGQPSKDAFTAAATALTEAAKAKKPVVDLTISYLDAAAQLKKSNDDTIDAANKANEENAQSYTDPDTGQQVANPNYRTGEGTNNGATGGVTNNGGSTGGNNNGGATNGSNGGNGGNGGANPPAPTNPTGPTVDHTPHVTDYSAGTYQASCGFKMLVDHQVMPQTTTSANFYSIPSGFGPHTYETSATSNGWEIYFYQC